MKTTVSLALALALCAAAAPTRAQTYPTKPIRVVVATAVGTGADVFARLLAQGLAEQYKEQVVVDNRTGAGGVIGSSIVAQAIADGYTLMMASTSQFVSPLLQLKPAYRPIEDFAAVAQVASIPSVLVVAPAVPAKTTQEFVAYARTRPGELNYASVGPGTGAHLSAEMFIRAAGLKSVHVPFKALGDIYSEMAASRVHFLVFVLPAALNLTRDGKLRALAVSSAQRNAALPDLPTFREIGLPEAEGDTMFGIITQAKVSRTLIAQLHRDIVAVLKKPDVRERFLRQGAEPTVEVSSAEYARRIKAEYEGYRKPLPQIGLKPQ